MISRRILLADDYPAILDDIRGLLENRYEVVSAVDNGEKLVEAASKFHPDLIVSDISMPVMTGFQAAVKIRKLGLAPKIIFLTNQSSPAYLKKARALGADGYVLKIFTHEELLPAVSSVLAGKSYVSPQLADARHD